MRLEGVYWTRGDSLEAAKLTSPVPGIGRGTSIGMALLGAFIDGRKPGEKIQMFMFMPESSVVDGDPLKTAEAPYVEALRKHLAADSFELVETVHTPTFGSKWTERYYLMKGGPRCGETGCYSLGSFFHSASSAPRAVKVDPLLTGDSTVYIASARPHIWPTSVAKSAGRTDPAESLELIKLLPPWFYVYLPGEVNLLMNSEGVLPLAK